MMAPSERDELERRRKRRISIAIALGLLAMVILFYLLTIFRLGGNIAEIGK